MSVQIERIVPGWTLIDLNFLGNPHIIGAYLVYDGKEAALVEVGPASTVEALLEGIKQVGVPLEAIRHLIVTHIHLDHAGALGILSERLPEAKVYVHPVGAPHVIDPSKLIASAARLYGSLMDVLWGAVLPVPEERVIIVGNGQELKVAGCTLVAVETPGHAKHHHAFFEPETGLLIAGDVAGVRMPEHDYIRPPTPPPELDLEAWSSSLNRLRGLPIQMLGLTHFGLFREAIQAHFDQLEERLYDWGGMIRRWLEAGQSDAEIVESLHQYVEQEMANLGIDPARYDVAASYQMVAMGYIRYWKKKLGE